jgi:hypothetical protein
MAYQYPLNGGRINASISGNSTSAGAGYQLVSTGTLVLAGGNNVTLNQNANSISIAGPSLSNSNGFTFGTNGSVVTASYAGGGSVNFSAGTTSGNLASVNLSNANGVSFGLNAGTITASHNALTSQSAQALSASNGSFAFQTAGFSNANGVTFGTSAGSIMTASVNTSYAASNHSHGNPTLNLTNLSGTTASASNGLTLSLSAASQSVQTQSNIQGIIANGSTNRTGDVSFANSNGVTFGLSNNTITASVAAAGQTNQTLGLYASGNSTGQSSSSTMDARSLSISAQGGVSAGFSGGMMQMSAPAVSSLSQTGIVSISRNGNTISIGAPAFSAGMSTGGNTSGTTGTVSNQLIFAGGNNITLSQNTGAGGNTISIIGGAGGGGGLALSANALISSGTASLAASGALTASVNGQTLNLSVPATSSIVGVNGITISTNGGTISISGNGGAGGGGAVARWEHPTAVFTTLPAIVNNSLSLQHVYMPFNFSGTEMKIGGSLSMGTHTSASTGSATINLKMGIYTLSGSTLSLLNSGSYSTGFGVSSNSTASYNGMRQFAVTGSFNLSAGEYWVGAILSTATNYASNPLGFTVYGNSAAPTAASNAILSPFGSAITASPRDVFLFQGMYGTTTTALPTAIQGSQINNSAASFVQRAQFYHAIYSATY